MLYKCFRDEVIFMFPHVEPTFYARERTFKHVERTFAVVKQHF